MWRNCQENDTYTWYGMICQVVALFVTRGVCVGNWKIVELLNVVPDQLWVWAEHLEAFELFLNSSTNIFSKIDKLSHIHRLGPPTSIQIRVRPTLRDNLDSFWNVNKDSRYSTWASQSTSYSEDIHRPHHILPPLYPIHNSTTFDLSLRSHNHSGIYDTWTCNIRGSCLLPKSTET